VFDPPTPDRDAGGDRMKESWVRGWRPPEITLEGNDHGSIRLKIILGASEDASHTQNEKKHNLSDF